MKHRGTIVWLSVVVVACGTALSAARYWPKTLSVPPHPLTPAWEIAETGNPQVTLPSHCLVAQVGIYDNELQAYLRFDYLRAFLKPGPEPLLTYKEVDGRPSYRIQLNLPNDLLTAIPMLVDLEQQRLIPGFEWRYAPPVDLAHDREQTRFFVAAYNTPAERKLEQLPTHQLHAGTSVFLAFKSATDRRVRKQIEPLPPALSRDDASEFAADIIAVAEFYGIPLDLFLGIGAMENNYMNVTGDLQNTAWKRRPQEGDVVLKRRRRAVQIRNESLGPWQITRETLRYAHKLYVADTRDYSELPERLRPPYDLSIDDLDTRLLTTYAGILLRDLLDHFEGDTVRAAGAYNGGRGNPNLKYSEGVNLVANYARSILEHAAAERAETVLHTDFSTPRRRSVR